MTAKVSFKEPASLPVPRSSAAHVSLSSNLQLSKNRRPKAVTKTRSKLAPRTQTSNPPIRLSFFRTRDFVASSAAALVSEWAYRTNPFSKSTALLEKNHFSFKSLFLQMKFRTVLKCGRFPDSDRPDRAGEVNILRLFAGKTALSSPAPRHDHNLLVLRDT
ncbi:hypothetical protein [Rhizobium phaseoli]|uniref:Uncharacterized protein n=2 Tax=Rhizobium phaseoli TaxID=396 RepID=A0A7X6J170_9HYPH|nr:hypothetical protein [Rhizobium phaseoli]NKF14178.1 hypothetical protein [Rhizobium phaseoli]QPK08986.1 hypothetical protein HER27_021605 [Rhizobium phaseoli]